MVRTSSRTRRLRPFIPYRPLVERLEDRLPPGDAVLAGLLAQGLVPERAAGASPGVPAASPGVGRPLAEAAPFALATDLELRTGASASVREAQVRGHAATVPGPMAELEVLAGEPFAIRNASLGQAARDMNPHARADFPQPFSVLEAPASAPGQGDLGALTQPRSPLTPTDYQLDQAVAALALPPAADARAGSVQALFDLGHPTTGPFPSNWFTVFDDTQNTWRRVNLPYPDCTVYVSDCEDIAVLNELDGFNLQPRLSIPFSGPIDVNTVNYTNVFLVSLGSTTEEEGFMPRGYGVGINQIVWDVETNALHVESDELLAQHTRFALYVTNGVLDAQGHPVGATEEFRNFRQTVQGDYREQLHDAMLMAGAVGVRERDLVTASVFTTQSATAVLEKMRDQIKAQTPEPADFVIGSKGERAVFDFTAQSNIVEWRHTGFDAGGEPTFTQVNHSLAALRVVPGVGQLALGKFLSPNYLLPEVVIPPVGTRTGTPLVQGANEIYFNLILPSGPKPVGGWPVAIFGHVGGGSKQVFYAGAFLAAQGIATIYLNAVGSGFGPLGTLTVNQGGSPVTLPAGGRGFDQNGDGQITSLEGGSAAAPWSILRNSDSNRQLVADLMQLVRVIEVGTDADGDGARDLDPVRIYYLGGSFGGSYGTTFLAIEPNIAAGVLNVPSTLFLSEATRSSVSRPLVGTWLTERTPPLANTPGITEIEGVPVGAPHFNENKPLRDGASFTVRLADGTTAEIRSPVVNSAEGAMAVQEGLENSEWARMSGDSIGYAPHLRRAPLAGVPTKLVIVQFAKGDQSAVNPGTTAYIRAGELADRATYYRHDLAYAEDPQLPKNPHGFMTSITSTSLLYAQIARESQRQIAVFFASGGKTIIHPEPARFFEVPIQGPLPEELNYIP